MWNFRARKDNKRNCRGIIKERLEGVKMNIFENIIEKIKHFHLKYYLYYTLKSFSDGLSIFEIAMHCPKKTDLRDVAECLEELRREGKIEYDGITIVARN
jgi:aryl-alcohol dehydrogenase-like predicted oxidoreductase